MPFQNAEPELLEVVPWNYGFAHSWALRWLLERADLADRVMGAVGGMDGQRAWSLKGTVEHEKPLRPARADLAFTLIDAKGSEQKIAVETKVNDPLRPEQLRAYVEMGYQPVVYLPGLTGLAAEAIPERDEARLKGAELARALEGTPLPSFIESYVRAVREEAERMADALVAARKGVSRPLADGQGDDHAIQDVAWLVAVRESLAKLQSKPEADERVGEEVSLRFERNDRGLFWAGSWTNVGNGAGLYLDVLADIRKLSRTIRLKAGLHSGGDRETLERAFHIARRNRPPDAHRAWEPSARRFAGGSVTVWKLDATQQGAVEAGRAASAAARWIKDVAETEASAS